jgi:hypothetical protein
MYANEFPNASNFAIFTMLIQDERARDKKADI